MQLLNNQEQSEILQKAKEFAKNELEPRTGEFDRMGVLPREIIDKMAQNGFLGATIPKKWGGLEMNPLEYGQLTEIIGKACASTRTLLTVHTSLVSETLVKRGSDFHKKKYLPKLAKGELIGCFALSEEETGSDALGVKTTYKKEGDHFVLNGTKKWISFSGIADLFLVIASDEGTVSAFLVERNTPGITTKPMSGLLGSRAAYISEIEFNNVEVPEENVVGKIGVGFSFVANTALFYGRYSIAWAGVAIAQSALEEMVTYSRKREQFGRKIGTNQLVQRMIANAVTKVQAARSLCIRAGQLRVENSVDAVMETNIAKYYSSVVANEVASDAVQVFGGNGCWNKYPVERLFREAKILEIIEGTSQMQELMIANYGMKKFVKK